jgi:methylase of polypeptide subunit release factors
MKKYNNYEKQNNLSRQILDLNRKKGDHMFKFNEYEYIVKEGVFSPEIFNGHQTFTPKLAELNLKNKSMLEIGAGSGITGLYLMKNNKLSKLTLADINPNAVSNCKLNVNKFKLTGKVDVIQSDVYDQIPKKYYDIVYWNHPWLPEEENYEYKDELDKGLFDPDYKYLTKYVKGLNVYLSKKGRAFLGFGDFGDVTILTKIAKESNFSVKEIIRETGEENGDVEFILYELVRKKMKKETKKITQDEAAKKKKFVEQNKASLEVLDANKKIGNHKITYNGITFTVKKDVFSPVLFNGWRTFTKGLVEQDLSDKSMLEIGAGSGITSLYLLLKKGLSSVYLSDISSQAVENCKLNAINLNVENKVTCKISNVFDSIEKNQKFDIIYWNCPWSPVPSDYVFEEVLEYGLFDPENVNLRKYLRGIHKHLAPNGRAFIAHADFGEIAILKSITNEEGFSIKKIISEESEENGKVIFDLFELLKNEK